ncbi:MAG: gamma-glutamyl-gamma-aminobutyrate hydrolase family protein [Bacteroides sp.]|nr:gamma-glutamyl-gamma-aminobutyrate hydrolase family protein [Bacteroides sp.]
MRKLFLLFVIVFSLIQVVAQETSKPLIGISCFHPDSIYSSVRVTYSESIIKAGGIPVLIPVTESENTLREILARIDALILSGGDDICPSYYGEDAIEELGAVNGRSDIYDLLLIKIADELNLPVFGICRGLQVMNVYYGGSLYQDIPTQHPDTTVNHKQTEKSNVATHRVILLPGSLIAQITEQTELMTNTHHHQAIKTVAPGFKVTAWTTDHIPEAIESTSDKPIWGVQFHPEGQAIEDNPEMLSFFKFLVNQAKKKE